MKLVKSFMPKGVEHKLVKYFRGKFAAASLKPAAATDAPGATANFPRIIIRGLIETFVFIFCFSCFSSLSLADSYYLLQERGGPSLSSLLTAAQIPFNNQQQMRQEQQQRQLMEAQKKQIEAQTRYLEALVRENQARLQPVEPARSETIQPISNPVSSQVSNQDYLKNSWIEW